MSTAEKRNAIDVMLTVRTERADNWIAEDLGVSDHTVSNRREVLESTSQIAKLDKLIGKDGRERPRKIQRKLKDVPAQKVTPGKVHTMDVIDGLRELDNASAASAGDRGRI